MSLMIAELIKEVTKRIEASEGRSRSRTTDEQLRFNTLSMYCLLTYGRLYRVRQYGSVASINVVAGTLRTQDTVTLF